MGSPQKFEYDAPTFVDFVNGMDDSREVDTFFDVVPNSQKTVTLQIKEEFTPEKQSTPNAKDQDLVDRAESYVEKENSTPNIGDICKTPNPHNGRRSRILFEALDGLCLTGSVKTHKMITRKDPRTPLLELRGRSVPKNVNFIFDHEKPSSKVCREILFDSEDLAEQMEKLNVNNNDEPELIVTHEDPCVENNEEVGEDKLENDVETREEHSSPLNETVTVEHLTSDARKRKVINSPIPFAVHNEKYISLAESALKFHDGFRAPHNVTKNHSKHLTVPKTPNLQTKSRARPTHILSHAEREDEVLKEIRSNQLKANPVPKGLYNPPKLGIRRSVIHKKPFTNTTVQPNAFKPTIYTANQNSVKVIETDQSGLVVTNKELGHRGVNHCKSKPKVIKPQPFSFHAKDIERWKQKEEKIKMIIEEERRQHEFYANPLPKFVRTARRRSTSGSHGSLNSTTCSHSSTCSSVPNKDKFVFRAKSPTVLHQKPFIPRKSMKPCSQIVNFTLHTEERSQQREVFEDQKKQKELELQLHLQEREREREERETREYLIFRKSLVHRPLPIPKSKPFVPHHANVPPTYPESPNFSKK